MMPDLTKHTGIDEERATPVWREARKGWEWAALGELMAMFIFAMVVLGACMGMVMQFVNPHRRAKKIAHAVQQAVEGTQQQEQQASSV